MVGQKWQSSTVPYTVAIQRSSCLSIFGTMWVRSTRYEAGRAFAKRVARLRCDAVLETAELLALGWSTSATDAGAAAEGEEDRRRSGLRGRIQPWRRWASRKPWR